MNDDQQPMVFQFKSLRWYFTYMPIAITPIAILFLVGAIQDKSLTGWFAFFLTVFLFYVLGSYLYIRASSDLVVGNGCISRRFAGRVIQSLSWDNIEEIRVFLDPTKDFANRIDINFVPIVKPRRSLTRTGRIVFSTEPLRTGHMYELINVINKMIVPHGIKVVRWVDGVKTCSDRLEWPLPQTKTERSRTW